MKIPPGFKLETHLGWNVIPPGFNGRIITVGNQLLAIRKKSGIYEKKHRAALLRIGMSN